MFYLEYNFSVYKHRRHFKMKHINPDLIKRPKHHFREIAHLEKVI